MSTSVPIIGPMQPPPRSVLLITDEIQKTIEYAAFQPDFYKLPADAVAHFSTNLGKQQKREVADPPPAPVVRSNVDDEIRRKAIELREQCPSIARRVTFPVTWSDLYYFFDGYDLWVEGPAFLFFVINFMSNENQLLDYENNVALIKIKKKEIMQWAAEYIENNIQRILYLPPKTLVTDYFTRGDWADVEGTREDELTCLQESLTLQLASKKSEMAQDNEIMRQSHIPQQTPRYQAGNGPHHPHDRVQQPHGQQRPPNGQRSQQQPQHLQHAQHSQPHAIQMIPPTFPVSHGMAGESFRGSVVQVHPIDYTQYQHFMDQQRSTGDRSQRPRGYSHEASQNGQYQRGVQNTNNRGSNSRNNNHFNDRRVSTSIDNRGNLPSRPGEVSTAGRNPVYVHNDIQSRMFSNSLTSCRGVSNDARQWDTSFEKRSFENQSTEKLPAKRSKPSTEQRHPDKGKLLFADDKMVRNTTKSCTYYYAQHALERASKDPQASREHYSTRALYVTGIDDEFFVSHHLFQLFKRHGAVEAISYLYTVQGTAFVMYRDEDPLDLAIKAINGSSLASGHTINVKIPEKRTRSDSFSSQGYGGQPNSQIDTRCGTSMRKQRSNQRGPESGNHNRIMSSSSTTSPGNRSGSPPRPYSQRYVLSHKATKSSENGSRSPLTAGFEAQLRLQVYDPIPTAQGAIRGPSAQDCSSQPLQDAIQQPIQKSIPFPTSPVVLHGKENYDTLEQILLGEIASQNMEAEDGFKGRDLSAKNKFGEHVPKASDIPAATKSESPSKGNKVNNNLSKTLEVSANTKSEKPSKENQVNKDFSKAIDVPAIGKLKKPFKKVQLIENAPKTSASSNTPKDKASKKVQRSENLPKPTTSSAIIGGSSPLKEIQPSKSLSKILLPPDASEMSKLDKTSSKSQQTGENIFKITASNEPSIASKKTKKSRKCHRNSDNTNPGASSDCKEPLILSSTPKTPPPPQATLDTSANTAEWPALQKSSPPHSTNVHTTSQSAQSLDVPKLCTSTDSVKTHAPSKISPGSEELDPKAAAKQSGLARTPSSIKLNLDATPRSTKPIVLDKSSLSTKDKSINSTKTPVLAQISTSDKLNLDISHSTKPPALQFTKSKLEMSSIVLEDNSTESSEPSAMATASSSTNLKSEASQPNKLPVPKTSRNHKHKLGTSSDSTKSTSSSKTLLGIEHKLEESSTETLKSTKLQAKTPSSIKSKPENSTESTMTSVSSKTSSSTELKVGSSIGPTKLLAQPATPSSPKSKLDASSDSADWPLLSKTPPQVRPVPERPAIQNIVPVIPLNMERRRQSLDSVAWPVVKKCSTK